MKARWSLSLSFCLLLVHALSGCESDATGGSPVPEVPDEGNNFREVDPPDLGPAGQGDVADDAAPQDDAAEPDADEEPDTYQDPFVPGDTSGEPVCGNGVREGNEECDGRDLVVDYCAAFGWTGTGDLTCNEYCLLEAPRCDTGLCGNGTVDPGEECDGGSSRTSAECTVDCRSAGHLETEPNDSRATANLIDAQVGVERRISGRLVSGDLDYFRFTITSPVEVIAYTSDGRGSCDLDTTLSLEDESGSELAYDDDGGELSCSEISTEWDPGAALSEPGNYYLLVEGFFGEQNGPYTLHVTLLEPVCGDGRLSAGEECDDEGTENGDGCDENCRYEAIDETEPNDTPAEADGPHVVTPATPALLRGEISEVDDVDVFAVPMGLGDSFTRIEVLAAGPTCNFDASVELLAPDGTTVLAQDAYGWDSTCASLTETSESEIADLEEGTHFVRVTSEYGDETGTYLLNLVVRLAECGNGRREGDEMCDDANEDPTDGCHECQLDADPEQEPNDSIEQSFDLGLFDTSRSTAIAAQIDAGDVDFFGLDISDDARVEVWTSDGASGCELDTVIEFLDSSGTEIASDDDDGELSCSRLDKNDPEMIGLDAGHYVIKVRPYFDDGTGFYVLHVAVRYPTCGDGVIEGAEICDDENTTDGDGCSALCLPEGLPEAEPNDAPETAADPISLTGSDEVLVKGAISPAGDVDYYRVSVASGAMVEARLWNGSGGCAVDSRVSLRSDAVTVVRSGVSLPAEEGCWQVGGLADPYDAGEALDAGEYLLRVAGRSGDTGAYQLVLSATYE